MAVVRLPNQGGFEISDDLVTLAEDTQAARERRDSLVRHALMPFAPSVTNATLSYREENGRIVVTVTPQLGRKAGGESIFATLHERLRVEPPYLDPALALAWEIRWAQLCGTLHPVDLLLRYRERLNTALDHQQHADRDVSDLRRALRLVEGMLPAGAPLGL
jgi:hypothetical protein